MSVQLIIEGQHIIDVLAQVQQLAVAISGDAPKNAVGATSGQAASTTSAPAKAPATSTAAPSTAGKPVDNKLTREEQDAAVEEMVAAGEKDGRYDLLTKGRQKNVDDGIAAKAAPTAKEDDLNDMFDEGDDAPETVVVTSDTIREMMGKLGKDEDGNPIQDNLVKIRDILTKFVTKGKDIKVGNIPAEKLSEVYAELNKLAA